MKTQLVLLLASVSLSIAPTANEVLAGPLGELNRDIGKQQDRSRSGSSSSSGSNDRVDHDHHNHRDWHGDGYGHRYARPSGVVVLDRRHPTSNFVPAPFHVSLAASYQNVSGSDGALNGDIHIGHGNVALSLSGSSYSESDQVRKGEATTDSTLTRWDLQIQGRSLRTANTELWIGGGIGQLRGSGFEPLTGLSLGLEAKHRLAARGFGIYGGARGIIYEDDLKATELRAGLKASVLRVGYRYFELNVGPPLHGPELGVALQF